jgi:hypothetical protein
MRLPLASAVVGLGLVTAGSVQADVEVFFDRAEWDAAVGPVTTLDFTGFPEGTTITDQYADVGAIFTDGLNFTWFNSVFKNDGVGLDGYDEINVAFDTPQLWVAVDFPGYIGFRLFFHGEIVHESGYGDPGNGWFVGLVSDEPFDSLMLIEPASDVEIDDLHFGVPAPGSIALLVVAALRPRRRR